MTTPVLFDEKKDCCACGACLNVCPKQAISLQEDEAGFLYPKINKDLCICCGACKKVCSFQNGIENNTPLKCFAAVSKNSEQRKKSASGGIFAALASMVIKEGGIVYGAAFDNEWNLRHISVSDLDNLKYLQGSKYVQSNTLNTFSEAKSELESGRKVLYSGTPCQISGLLQYLGKDYDNLLTIDIVCHGVPSNRMFKDYIKLLENKIGSKLTGFSFRDKTMGWGINGSAFSDDKKIRLWQSASSYLYYFSNASIYRENCYFCKYAGMNRPADFTIGDFWGIEKQHPQYLDKLKWDEQKGISLLICNTTKGMKYSEKMLDYVELKESNFMMLSRGNAQLNHPSKSNDRNEIIKFYINNGYKALDHKFRNTVGVMRFSSIIKAYIPKKLKRFLKRFS